MINFGVAAFRQSKDKDLEEVNKVRVKLKMPPVVKGFRECLRCEVKFQSADLKNQKCCEQCRNWLKEETR